LLRRRRAAHLLSQRLLPVRRAPSGGAALHRARADVARSLRGDRQLAAALPRHAVRAGRRAAHLQSLHPACADRVRRRAERETAPAATLAIARTMTIKNTKSTKTLRATRSTSWCSRCSWW